MPENMWNPSFDVQHTAPDWEADLAFGQQGEQIVEDFLQAINQRRFEVKYDRYRNGRMVVETDQNPRREGWKPSGINVTEADWWVYMFSPGAFLMVPVDRLKRFLRGNLHVLSKREFAAGSPNPAKGFLLFPNQVHDLLNNPDWD